MALSWFRELVNWEKGRSRSDREASMPATVSVAAAHMLCADADGSNCWPGRRSIVKEYRVSPNTVSELRSRWTEAGWLVDTGQRRNGGVVVYQLTIPQGGSRGVPPNGGGTSGGTSGGTNGGSRGVPNLRTSGSPNLPKQAKTGLTTRRVGFSSQKEEEEEEERLPTSERIARAWNAWLPKVKRADPVEYVAPGLERANDCDEGAIGVVMDLLDTIPYGEDIRDGDSLWGWYRRLRGNEFWFGADPDYRPIG